MKKLMVITALLIFIAGSANAADWNFYGSARVATFYTKMEVSPFDGGADTDNYEQNLNGNGRIGARVKVSDTLTGQFEYGALGGKADVRILWGEWNFGGASLGIGQHYTPLFFPYSNQVYNISALNKGDHNMSTYGMLYGDRKAQIRLNVGGFRVALVELNSLVSFFPGGAAQPKTEVKTPQIQAKYQYNFENGHVAFAGGYGTFDVLSGSKAHKVNSYLAGIGGSLNIGSAYLKGNLWGGQNVGNLACILVSGSLWSTAENAGTSDFDGDGWGLARWDGTKVTDRNGLGALIVAGYKIREGLYLETGYGYVSTELDMAGSKKDDAATYYIQSTIFLAPGVSFTPEIGRIDSKQDGQFGVTYFGIKWQINF